MSQLEQLTTQDFWCPSEEYPSPGVFVKHVKDDKSYGMIVGRVGTEVLILWSVEPFAWLKIKKEEIKSTSRKLNVKWSVPEPADDLGPLDKFLTEWYS